MELRGVEVSETVCRLLDRGRLAQVTGEALPVVGLILSGVRHVGRDVHQTGHRWIRPRFGDYSSPVTMGNEDARTILSSKDARRGSDVFFKRRLRLLNDA